MNRILKNLVFTLVPLVAAGLLFVAGLMMGQHWRNKPVSGFVAAMLSESTMADSNEQLSAGLDAIAQVYLNPQQAQRELAGYIWDVPSVPTPYIGAGPSPGREGGANITPQQFRGPRDPAIPKPAGVYRIILIGGSTAFGLGAPNDDALIGAYLQRLLNEQPDPRQARTYEVFTLARPAWASTHERILVENRIAQFEPDLVISLSGNNDAAMGKVGADILWFFTYGDMQFMQLLNLTRQPAGLQALPVTEQRSDLPVPPDLVAQRLLYNVQLACHALQPTSIRYLYALQPNIQNTAKALSPREQVVRSNDSPLYFQGCYGAIRRELAALEQSGRFPRFSFVDLSDTFDALPAGEEIYLDSCHFADKGNERVARRLLLAVKTLATTHLSP